MDVEPQYHDSLRIIPELQDISDAEDSEDESGDLLWRLDGEEGIANLVQFWWKLEFEGGDDPKNFNWHPAGVCQKVEQKVGMKREPGV
jgi:hypothetical protein